MLISVKGNMINFVLDKSKNYEIIQRDLNGILAAHLDPKVLTSTFGYKLPGALNFTLFVRQPANVLMSHGVADKNYFTDIRDESGDLFINRLDALMVPGEWMKRKLLAHPDVQLQEHQIICVGWPRLDQLRSLVPSALLQCADTQTRKKVLWAPTHDFAKKGAEQISTSSYPMFSQYLSELEKYCDVKTSLHPRNRSSKVPTYQEVIDADVVISDFGTVVYEAWSLGKPVIFPTWLIGNRIKEFLPGSAEAHIYIHEIGYHAKGVGEMIEWLQSDLQVGEDVDRFMDDYLLNYREGLAGQRVAQVLSAFEPFFEDSLQAESPTSVLCKKSGFEIFLEELHAQTPDRAYNWTKDKEIACQWILEHVVSGKGVDVGGTEYLCEKLAAAGRDIIYYDINLPQRYSPSIQDDMVNILEHFKPKSLDFIISRHTLEHSVAPMFQLWAYNRILKDNGQLIVVVPIHTKEWVWFHTHHNCLPLENWLMLFHRAGFKIQESGSGSWNPRRPLFMEMRFDLRVDSRVMRLGGGAPSY